MAPLVSSPPPIVQTHHKSNYELAKQLKDAGFPQKGRGKEIAPTKCDIHEMPRGAGYCRECGFAYAPTLEELMEACGEVEFKIHCYPKGFHNDVTSEPWFVIERPNTMDMERCSTPKIAVARLWLALNFKK